MLSFFFIFMLAIAIGSAFYKKTASKLEAAQAPPHDTRDAITSNRADIFASRKSHNLMIGVTLFIAALYLGLLVFVISDGLFMLLLPTVIFGPVLWYLIFVIWRVEKAVRAKTIVMHIDRDGFKCHSKILGKLRQNSWQEVKQFYPATRRQGAVSSIIVEFKLSGKHNAVYFQDKVQFQTAAINQDIVELLGHFEHFSGLKAGHLRKTWN